jgi:uncharacterized protein YqfA (UPF0365 family)
VTLKKATCGAGNVDKVAMIAAAVKRWSVQPADDNEADALNLLAYGIRLHIDARRAAVREAQSRTDTAMAKALASANISIYRKEKN